MPCFAFLPESSIVAAPVSGLLRHPNRTGPRHFVRKRSGAAERFPGDEPRVGVLAHTHIVGRIAVEVEILPLKGRMPALRSHCIDRRERVGGGFQNFTISTLSSRSVPVTSTETTGAPRDWTIEPIDGAPFTPNVEQDLLASRGETPRALPQGFEDRAAVKARGQNRRQSRYYALP